MDEKFQEDDEPQGQFQEDDTLDFKFQEEPEEFPTAFPNPADVPGLKNPEGFESAFPETTGTPPGEDGILRCIHGCGRAAQFGDLKRSEFGHGQPGDPPRCSKNMSDCPVVSRKAIRAAKETGRLGRRWVSRF